MYLSTLGRDFLAYLLGTLYYLPTYIEYLLAGGTQLRATGIRRFQ